MTTDIKPENECDCGAGSFVDGSPTRCICACRRNPMTHRDIKPENLLTLARAASSGPWKATPCTDEGEWRVTRNHDSIVCCTGGYPTGEPDAAYIAAASPDVIVALCERVEALEAQSRKLIEQWDEWGRGTQEHNRKMETELDALRALAEGKPALGGCGTDEGVATLSVVSMVEGA